MASKSKRLESAADIFAADIDGAIRKIPIGQIIPSEDQPRKDRDINIQSLAESLATEGLLQPIVVTKKTGTSQFSIIAGERRYRAANLLGWSEIECRILKKDAREKYKLAVIENLQRENLNAVDEAFSYKKLKEDFDYTDQKLSEIIGKSRNYISEIMSIAEIPAENLKKASEAGIEHKNLLVQYAQAIKKNLGEEFLQSFLSGEMGTVKKAKNFLKNPAKTTSNNTETGNSQGSPEPETSLPVKKTTKLSANDILVRAEWLDEKKIRFEVEFLHRQDFSFPLEELENQLARILTIAIKGLS